MSPLTPEAPSTFEGVGLSDDEELRRFAAAFSDAQPAGEEVLIDMTEDLRELGIER